MNDIMQFKIGEDDGRPHANRYTVYLDKFGILVITGRKI